MYISLHVGTSNKGYKSLKKKERKKESRDWGRKRKHGRRPGAQRLRLGGSGPRCSVRPGVPPSVHRCQSPWRAGAGGACEATRVNHWHWPLSTARKARTDLVTGWPTHPTLLSLALKLPHPRNSSSPGPVRTTGHPTSHLSPLVVPGSVDSITC